MPEYYSSSIVKARFESNDWWRGFGSRAANELVSTQCSLGYIKGRRQYGRVFTPQW
jgi:hypothetical protein